LLALRSGAPSLPEGCGPLVIAGAGSIGRRHLENLRRLGRTDVAFYRAGRGAVSEGAAQRDLDSILARRPRAVLVCNPTALHMSVALEAARAGAALFIEKPVSHDLEGVAELQATIAERRLVTLVGFQYRFHPALVRVREWIQGGAVGEVVSARAEWGEYLPSWHPEEDYRRSYAARKDLGGGALLTLCHPFDYLRLLLGEVQSVSAETCRRSGLEIDVEDTAQVILRFASGALGVVSLDYVQRPRTHAFEVVGRRGRILWNEAEGIARLHNGETGAVEVCAPPPGFSRNTMFLDEMGHFLACLDGEDTPRCTFDDGLHALRISLAARRSAGEGRTVAIAEHLDEARVGWPLLEERA
jgi:predicted dehydrogenase